jgi:hypothetical protein
MMPKGIVKLRFAILYLNCRTLTLPYLGVRKNGCTPLEIFQWDDKADIEKLKSDTATMDKIRDEIADITMYILSLVNQLDIDLSDAVLSKLEKNREKYDKHIVLKTGAYRKDKL